ncbi:DUF397 domain-containing protein [Actinomadura graeca]|uniref:DUF397 domain-containing protein n=1 Tax=Actinomadura graeca TaxID=2750812 RepID=A0ABX8QZ93_9ACTN|nr:DUF397 domain-containing protein [Actinomadura graeca]QXJ23983.1 DUF397 domain-containing protein [Actinomadura graeca]
MDLTQARWRRASHSTVENDNCVEVAGVASVVVVRDSKDPDGPKLLINHNDFRHFAGILKSLQLGS